MNIPVSITATDEAAVSSGFASEKLIAGQGVEPRCMSTPDELLKCIRDVVDRPYVVSYEFDLRRVMQKLAFLLTINHRSSSLGLEIMDDDPERSECTLRWLVGRTRPTIVAKRVYFRLFL